MAIKINTGRIRLEVDCDGVKNEISFNPNDINFVDGVYNLLSDLEKKQEDYKERIEELEKDNALDESGVPLNIQKRLAIIKEICIDLEKQIDIVFGEGTSKKAFGDALCFEMFEQFFNGITPYIEKARADKLKKYKTVQKNVM